MVHSYVQKYFIENIFSITLKSANVIYSLKCNMCSNRDLHWKDCRLVNAGFKSQINHHILDCTDDDPRCKFLRHEFSSCLKNGDLNGPFFDIKIMMSLKDPQKPEYYEQGRGYDTLNNRHSRSTW